MIRIPGLLLAACHIIGYWVIEQQKEQHNEQQKGQLCPTHNIGNGACRVHNHVLILRHEHVNQRSKQRRVVLTWGKGG